MKFGYVMRENQLRKFREYLVFTNQTVNESDLEENERKFNDPEENNEEKITFTEKTYLKSKLRRIGEVDSKLVLKRTDETYNFSTPKDFSYRKRKHPDESNPESNGTTTEAQDGITPLLTRLIPKGVGITDLEDEVSDESEDGDTKPKHIGILDSSIPLKKATAKEDLEILKKFEGIQFILDKDFEIFEAGTDISEAKKARDEKVNVSVKTDGTKSTVMPKKQTKFKEIKGNDESAKSDGKELSTITKMETKLYDERTNMLVKTDSKGISIQPKRKKKRKEAREEVTESDTFQRVLKADSGEKTETRDEALSSEIPVVYDNLLKIEDIPTKSDELNIKEELTLEETEIKEDTPKSVTKLIYLQNEMSIKEDEKMNAQEFVAKDIEAVNIQEAEKTEMKLKLTKEAKIKKTNVTKRIVAQIMSSLLLNVFDLVVEEQVNSIHEDHCTIKEIVASTIESMLNWLIQGHKLDCKKKQPCKCREQREMLAKKDKTKVCKCASQKSVPVNAFYSQINNDKAIQNVMYEIYKGFSNKNYFQLEEIHLDNSLVTSRSLKMNNLAYLDIEFNGKRTMMPADYYYLGQKAVKIRGFNVERSFVFLENNILRRSLPVILDVERALKDTQPKSNKEMIDSEKNTSITENSEGKSKQVLDVPFNFAELNIFVNTTDVDIHIRPTSRKIFVTYGKITHRLT